MMFCSFLLISGLAHLARATDCVYETLECLKLRRRFNTHKELYETPYGLDRECRLQASLFSCLRSIAPLCSEGYELSLPKNLEKKEDALLELCTEASELRERYLLQSSCINRQDTSYCTSETFLGEDMELVTSPGKRCLLMWKGRQCIATLLKEECGDDASYLFRELMESFESDDYDCAEPDDEYDTESAEPEVEESEDESEWSRRYGEIYDDSEIYHREHRQWDSFEESSEPSTRSAVNLGSFGDGPVTASVVTSEEIVPLNESSQSVNTTRTLPEALPLMGR